MNLFGLIWTILTTDAFVPFCAKGNKFKRNSALDEFFKTYFWFCTKPKPK